MTPRHRPDRKGILGTLALILPLALLFGAGCPKPHPVERPRPKPFDPMAAKRLLEERAQTLVRSGPAGVSERAAIHRDLGWLLWVHRGDADAARREWSAATRLLDGLPPPSRPAAPWLKAGFAAVTDMDLSVGRAARAWIAVLLEVERAQRAGQARLAPIPGADLERLAVLAVDRLGEQLRHLAEPMTDAELASLAAARLPPLVLSAVAQARMTLARRSGDRAAVDRLAAEAGCPGRFLVSPRFGRFPRLDLATSFAPESQAGPLQGRLRTPSGCRLTLSSPDGRGGVRYLETTVRSERTGPALLQFAWPLPAVVWVNGERVHGPDPEARPRPLLRVIPLRLRQGENRVRIKVPVSATPRDLQLLVAPVTRGTAPARAKRAAGKRPRPRRSGPGPRGTPRLEEALAATYRPLGDLLELHAALHAGLPDAGRPAAERLEREAPRFTLGHLAVALLEESDMLQSQDLGRERARPHLAKVLAIRPAAARARLALASLLRHQDRSKDALALVQSAPRGDSDVTRLLAYARIQLAVDLGWRSLATREAEGLAARHPRWLAAWQLHHRLAVMEHGYAAVRAAAARLRALDATSLAQARVLAAEGRLPDALAELARVASVKSDLGADLEPRWLRRLGRDREARRELAARLARASWDSERRLALADVLVALGERDAAVETLTQGLAAHPEHRDYRRALLALGVTHPMEPHRVSGTKAISEYRTAAWTPGKKPVYVLDRAVIRVFPSGGRLVLTHQIVHLRTKEDVHRYAEVRLPPGAEVLTLRTVKADGSTREPEEIAGKQSLSLQDVDVGDYIEAEYVNGAPPEPWWRPGGFYGDGFSFQSVSAHFFRSELVVVTAPDYPIVLDRRGPAPEPVVTTLGGLRVTTFTARRMARLEPEPLSASLIGILPGVQIGSGISWPDYLRQRRELAWGLGAASHRVRAIARELCHGTPGERARKAYAWVQANVEESGGLYVSAAATAARRSGSRITLLSALLTACGIAGQRTYLVWPRHLEHTVGPLPPLPSYSQPLLGVDLAGEGEVYLLPQVQQAPFGYLPPTLQGALAVTPERATEKPRRLPAREDAEAHDTRLQVVLARDGSAVVSGRDTLRGVLALQLRAAIRSVPEKQLRQAMEQVFFGRHFAGATLTRLQFDEAGATEKPLGIQYRLEVPSLARVEGNRLVLGAALFPSQAGRQWGALPTRTLPLQLGPLGPRRITADIELPAGYALVEEPALVSVRLPSGPLRLTTQSTAAPVRFDTPWGRQQVTLTRTKSGVRLERSLHIPFRVVSPTDYPAFTAVAAAWDRLEAPVLRFAPATR